MKLFRTREVNEAGYVKQVYFEIIFLSMLIHSFYIFIFAFLSLTWLSVYNCVSALFYFILIQAVLREHYRFAVTVTHIEVCLFVTVCTLVGGWDLGIPLYLFSLASLVYFCPYNHKFVPYLFSLFEILLYIFLKLYSDIFPPFYAPLSETAGTCLYLYNVCICFAIILFAAFASDVSAAVSKKRLQDENDTLSTLANYDQLTGLLTRRPFLQKLEQFQQGPAVIVMGDIDNFKRFNDTYGHNCGDYILRMTAELMRASSGSQVDICRWGGEEFVLLYPMTKEEAEQETKKLCEAIAQKEYFFEHHILHVTMTFGLCERAEGMQPDQWIAAADERMYLGKKQGKNRVVSNLS